MSTVGSRNVRGVRRAEVAEDSVVGYGYGVAVGRVRSTQRGREELAYLGEDWRVAFRADGAALCDTVREARVLADGLPDEEHSGRDWFGVRREGFPRIVRIELTARVTWC